MLLNIGVADIKFVGRINRVNRGIFEKKEYAQSGSKNCDVFVETNSINPQKIATRTVGISNNELCNDIIRVIEKFERIKRI